MFNAAWGVPGGTHETDPWWRASRNACLGSGFFTPSWMMEDTAQEHQNHFFFMGGLYSRITTHYGLLQNLGVWCGFALCCGRAFLVPLICLYQKKQPCHDPGRVPAGRVAPSTWERGVVAVTLQPPKLCAYRTSNRTAYLTRGVTVFSLQTALLRESKIERTLSPLTPRL